MKASIVIPAWNESKGIEATIRAALAQDTHHPFEVIVVDNNSIDGTGDIARAHGVRVVTERQQGLLHAREAGRRAAGGEIIVQLDADSLPPSDWFTLGLRHFCDRSVVAVSGPYDYYDAGPQMRWLLYAGYVTLNPLWHAILQAKGSGGMTLGSNIFVRASALERVDGYRGIAEAYGVEFYGEDMALGRAVAPFGRIIYDTRLCVRSSARRFKKLGLIGTFAEYAKHARTVYQTGQQIKK